MRIFGKVKRMVVIIIAMAVSLSVTSCMAFSQLEKQAIISAIGIDAGENARFKVSAQVFQAMGAGSATPVDGSETNTIIVSAEADTIAQCMEEISLILGRKINTGHNKYIVIGKDALEIPLSESLDYFIRSEQTYLGVPVICAYGDAREVINVKMQNEVETAIAIENIIRGAAEHGEAVYIDLLRIANSETAALPVIKVQEPEQEDGGDDMEKEGTQLVFSGTQIVRNGEILYTASQEETRGYCWLEGKLKTAQLCIYIDDKPINISVTKLSHKDTIRRTGDGGYEMVYKIKARINLLDSFSADKDEICRITEDILEEQCRKSFLSLSENPDADFLGVQKTAHSVYPKAAYDVADILSICGINAQFTCTLDR